MFVVFLPQNMALSENRDFPQSLGDFPRFSRRSMVVYGTFVYIWYTTHSMFGQQHSKFRVHHPGILSSSINFHMSIRKFKHIRFIRLRLTTFPDVSLDLLPISSWWPWFRLANRWVFVIWAFDPPINPQLRFSLFDAWWPTVSGFASMVVSQVQCHHMPSYSIHPITISGVLEAL